MNPPSEDLKDILLAEAGSSLALAYATNLYIGEVPVENDGECVCLYDTGGEPPDAHVEYERPHVQVRVRGGKRDYLGAHSLAQGCRDALNGIYQYTINGARYIGIWCMGDIIFVAWDDENRPVFTVNFRIHRTGA